VGTVALYLSLVLARLMCILCDECVYVYDYVHTSQLTPFITPENVITIKMAY